MTWRNMVKMMQLDSHCSLLANKLVATEQELEETKSKLAMVESHRNFSLLVKSPESFVHTWRIENWSQKILEAKAGVNEYSNSNPFYVPPGYHLYLRAYANHSASSQLAIYLHPTEGDFDGVIKWPFPFSFTLELVDQQPDRRNISFKCSPPYGEGYLEKPAISKGGYGVSRMASYKTLEKHCYIKDDTIIIKLTVDVKKY